jgi:Zn-dependent protease
MKGYNPFFSSPPPLHHQGAPKIRFSRTEALHLAVAVLALSYAFSLLLDSEPGVQVIPTLTALAAAFAAVASGFVFHELAHKLVAQRYGHWAEFRAHFTGLAISLALAISTGLLFAAPGAVMIQGRVTPKENGLISLVGPGVNFVIALACIPFYMFAVNEDALVPRIFATVSGVNALLAVFNLIPIDPFDGRKVLRWSKTVYGISVVACASLFIFTLTQNVFP